MRFGVVGDPVGHSRSPAIHTAAFAVVGIEATYELLPTRPEEFADVVRRIRLGALDGVNVTMPYKDRAHDACDRTSDSAARTRAVNTMLLGDGGLDGYNTDVDGVRHTYEIVGRLDAPVLILGSGGAARAALVALEGCSLSLSSRSPATAHVALGVTGVNAAVVPWGSPVEGAVVVNATPLGMAGEDLPPDAMRAASGLMDLAYGATPTPAIASARDRGLPFADGLDMLVGQAATAFTLFTGYPAPLDAMADAARG